MHSVHCLHYRRARSSHMQNQPPYIYEAEIERTGERVGELHAAALPTIEVAPPEEFQGPVGYWSPEHLYLASVTSCFFMTFLAIADASKLKIVSFGCSAKGILE